MLIEVMKRIVQILASACIAAGVIILMRHNLYSLVPYQCSSSYLLTENCQPDRIWQSFGEDVFSCGLLPLVGSSAVAGYFLPSVFWPNTARRVRLLHSVISMPLIPLLLATLTSPVVCAIGPGLMLPAIVGIGLSSSTSREKILLLAWNSAALLIAYGYMFLILTTFGD